MNAYTKQLKEEFDNSGKFPLFQFNVIDEEGEEDYVECEIYFKRCSRFKCDYLVAERDAVNLKEDASRYVATNKLMVDSMMSLDEHLQGLYELVHDSIQEGELFTLAD